MTYTEETWTGKRRNSTPSRLSLFSTVRPDLRGESAGQSYGARATGLRSQSAPSLGRHRSVVPMIPHQSPSSQIDTDASPGSSCSFGPAQSFRSDQLIGPSACASRSGLHIRSRWRKYRRHRAKLHTEWDALDRQLVSGRPVRKYQEKTWAETFGWNRSGKTVEQPYQGPSSDQLRLQSQHLFPGPPSTTPLKTDSETAHSRHSQKDTSRAEFSRPDSARSSLCAVSRAGDIVPSVRRSVDSYDRALAAGQTSVSRVAYKRNKINQLKVAISVREELLKSTKRIQTLLSQSITLNRGIGDRDSGGTAQRTELQRKGDPQGREGRMLPGLPLEESDWGEDMHRGIAGVADGINTLA